MKILLVQSWLGGYEAPVYPIGLASLKSALTGHDARIFDPNVTAKPLDELKDAIREFQPDAVGVSLRNIDSTNKRKVIFYYEYFKQTLTTIREVTNAPIITGGSGFSMYAAEIMADEPRIDYGVYLEGEETIARLLDNLKSPGLIHNVYYRKENKITFTGVGTQTDIRTIHPPDYQAVDKDKYIKFRDAFGIETKRGCALDCVYCIYGFLNGKNYRQKDPSRVVDEIESLLAAGIDRFTFIDSVFNLPQKHAREICEEITRRKLPVTWSAWFNEKAVNAEFVELAIAAGCRNVILSPDGYSDETLSQLGKNIKRADIERSFEILSRYPQIEVSYNFFKNPPGQSIASFFALAAFCVRAKRRMGKRVHFEFNSIRVEPHTKLFDIAAKEGLVDDKTDMLRPVYYTNTKTFYIEKLFNFALAMKGK